MRVTQLQQACEDKGIEHVGLNKKGMIQALLSHAAQDAFDDDGGAERQDLEIDDEGEISFRRVGNGLQNGESVGETSSIREMRQGESSDTESLSLLELKLAVLREERQKNQGRERDGRQRMAHTKGENRVGGRTKRKFRYPKRQR